MHSSIVDQPGWSSELAPRVQARECDRPAWHGSPTSSDPVLTGIGCSELELAARAEALPQSSRGLVEAPASPVVPPAEQPSNDANPTQTTAVPPTPDVAVAVLPGCHGQVMGDSV
jgi:hypothetical protein